ncbi:MAG: UDP-glucose 4-epimerase GalE [Bacilli bacterium]|nr:UDP-glucose 4-epimerase GalE [Bacilli bacterium]
MAFKNKILVTGGLGYIGSHTVISLIENGYDPIIVDNMCNSKIEALNRIEKISGVRPNTYIADVRDEEKMEQIFKENKIDAVIHFAGLKAVGESVQKPKLYYDNNIGSTEVLLKKMKEHGVKNIVFSSSATVYGNPKKVPIVESDPIGEVTNPYADTKVQIEYILQALAKQDPSLGIAILRYFNPIGAHPSGLIGEDPRGIPNNLMPYVTQVAVGKLPELNVFGNDYPTRDGTCIRDYIHVCDLARGHVLTLKKLEQGPGLVIYNLGTSVGTTVLELVNAFMKANNITIPYKIAPRRAGDIPECYANCDKAYKEIGFKTQYNIVDCCRDSWNWQKKNPNGLN